jgi:RND family efflux transporter MFP subunit
MADQSNRISQLKIDRSTPVAPGRSWLWPGLIVATVIVALLSWAFLRPGAGAVRVETDVARNPPSAAVADSVLDASGYVVARRQTTVSSKVTGKVLEVFVEEGMRVEQDQVVAVLDDTTQQVQLSLAKARAEASRAALQEIEARLRNARLERDRLRDLAKRGLTSTASVDAVDATYDELAARLETGRENVKVAERSIAVAEDDLSNMTIRAPFAGMVVSKNAQPGEMISPVSAGGGFTRTGICTVIDTDSLEIEVDVNEAYIQRVQPGQRVSATLDAYAEWRIPAEVIAIIPTADRQKATVRVRIAFLERDDRVLRDMGVKVAFLDVDAPATPVTELQDTPGVLIAGEALRSDSAGDFVWRIIDGRVERRGVQVSGRRDRTRILVTSGLSTGETIVRSSTAPLVAGQAITTD